MNALRCFSEPQGIVTSEVSFEPQPVEDSSRPPERVNDGQFVRMGTWGKRLAIHGGSLLSEGPRMAKTGRRSGQKEHKPREPDCLGPITSDPSTGEVTDHWRKSRCHRRSGRSGWQETRPMMHAWRKAELVARPRVEG